MLEFTPETMALFKRAALKILRNQSANNFEPNELIAESYLRLYDKEFPPKCLYLRILMDMKDYVRSKLSSRTIYKSRRNLDISIEDIDQDKLVDPSSLGFKLSPKLELEDFVSYLKRFALNSEEMSILIFLYGAGMKKKDLAQKMNIHPTVFSSKIREIFKKIQDGLTKIQVK